VRAERTRGAVLLPLLLLAGYLWVRPPVGDLAAQVGRANVFRLHGTGLWWTGWFGGLTLPTYSVLTPWLMATLSAPLTGALAAVVALFAARHLLRSAPRPLLGTTVFGLLDVANLVDGRVTFGVGLALGLLSLCALGRSPARAWTAAAAAGAVLSFLASPLAGLFTGLAALAVLLTDRRRRLAAGLTAAALLALGLAFAVAFPGTGAMPTTVLDMLPALAATAGVALLCPVPAVRTGAALTAAATVGFLLVPGPVGENVTRLAWVMAAPAVVAHGRLPGRLGGLPARARAAALTIAALAAALAPAFDLTNQVHAAHDASASPSFYAPLESVLLRDQRAHPELRGARAEVVDPRTHWSSVYVADRIPLARGWNRQSDAALDPLFYRPGALTAASYTAWLRSLAVGWVAVPHTPLDDAAVAEAGLVTSGLPGLRLIWTSADWRLYRVVRPSPLVEGARLTALEPAGVTVTVDAAGPVLVRVRWTPALVVENADRPATPPVCTQPSPDGMVTALLPAGRWTVEPHLLTGVGRRLGMACEAVPPP
jgi:hypothetical protein